MVKEELQNLLDSLAEYETKIVRGEKLTNEEKSNLTKLYKCMQALKTSAIIQIIGETFTKSDEAIEKFVEEKKSILLPKIAQLNEQLKVEEERKNNGLNNNIEKIREGITALETEAASIANLLSNKDDFIKYVMSREASPRDYEGLIRTVIASDNYTATTIFSEIEPFFNNSFVTKTNNKMFINVPNIKLALEVIDGKLENYEKISEINELDMQIDTYKSLKPVRLVVELVESIDKYKERETSYEYAINNACELEKKLNDLGIFKVFASDKVKDLEYIKRKVQSLRAELSNSFANIKLASSVINQYVSVDGLEEYSDLMAIFARNNYETIITSEEIPEIRHDSPLENALIGKISTTKDLRIKEAEEKRNKLLDEVSDDLKNASAFAISKIYYYGREKSIEEKKRIYKGTKISLQTLLIIDKAMKGELIYNDVLSREEIKNEQSIASNDLDEYLEVLPDRYR